MNQKLYKIVKMNRAGRPTYNFSALIHSGTRIPIYSWYTDSTQIRSLFSITPARDASGTKYSNVEAVWKNDSSVEDTSIEFDTVEEFKQWHLQTYFADYL